MKKKLLMGVVGAIFAFATIGLTACEGGSDPSHTTHTYDKQVMTDAYKKSNATCTVKATYYYSCECGKKGTETFETGGFGSHNMVDGSCTVCHKSEAQGLEYELSEDETYYIVTGIGTCTDTDLIIPALHEGKPVKEIGDDAFNLCTRLTSVMVGDSVTNIGDYAFYCCNSLTSVDIPNSVTSIGGAAFSGWTNLTKVNYTGTINDWAQISCGDWIENGYDLYINDVLVTEANITTATKISDYAFEYCKSLKKVIISEAVENIGIRAFEYCKNLTSIEVDEDNATYASQGEVLYNKAKTEIVIVPFGRVEVVIADSVTSIKNYQFQYFKNLASVTIPASVTSIGEKAFYNCGATIYCEAQSKPSGWRLDWNLQDKWGNDCPTVWDCNNNDVAEDGNVYTVMEGIRYAIKDGEATVVEQPENLKTAYIPENIAYKGLTYPVKSIAASAFTSCDSLTEVTIPDSVISIGQNAFWYCSNLNRVTIGRGVAEIHCNVFDVNCNTLKSVVFSDTTTWYRTSNYEDWQNKTGGTVMDVTVPTTNAERFTTIGEHYHWYKVD